MSANHSFSNESILDPYFPYICFVTSPGLSVFSSFCVTYVTLLLPLCIFILHTGLHQRRLSRQTSSGATLSHSDSFACHMVGVEMVGILGSIICLCGNCIKSRLVFTTGINIFSFTLYGQVFFHILTCLERYLAVVHPVTYLSLRRDRGIRIRNISTACIWLLCLVWFSVMMTKKYSFLDVCLLLFSTTTISFFSLSVLWVLIRPGPGNHGDSRVRVDQSKQRAFYTIVTILGVLMLRLYFGLVWAGLNLSGENLKCVMMVCGVWVNLPSSLVLPLLFLQRTGRIQSCKNIRCGQDVHK